ncbi:MAG: NAD-dependent DNA ligase LigA [Planctomycetaceae bacterium]|jgi:DNA ligase (NAD+)|nr:NAD-dependent DNA ligase LigA [Planctomycetaceae bacterium]
MSINELRKKLWDYDRSYRLGEPIISDTKYDSLLRQLRKLEAESNEEIPPDSPTQRLGGEPMEGLITVPHRIPMLSIENTYNIGELREFGNRVTKLLGGTSNGASKETKEPAWIVELKIDGVAASLIYEGGLLVQGLTRGNGILGDDITHNIRTLRDIPLRLTTKKPPKQIEIRGEIYMRNSDLVLLNQSQQAAGLTTYANTRNVTAGSVRLLDPKICAERRLRFFAHSIGFCNGLNAENHFDFLKELETYGIPVTPHVRRFDSFSGAVDYCESLYAADENFLSDLDFEIDGLVLKLDRFDLREKLGSTSKSPRWIIAYKVEKYEAVTTLLNIRVQVGKTGAITPVAELEPLELAGTTVSRASLHNAEEIERKDIRIGDVVVVEKAGKIIPHVVRVEKHKRTKKLSPFEFPKQCPVCGSVLSQDDGGVYIRCSNSGCPAQIKEKLRYFAGRNAMDIEGLGKELIDQLVDSGLVKNFGDLYRLTWDKIRAENLERMKAKPKKPNEIPLLVKNLLDGIEKSKNYDLGKLLNALCIRHVGIRVAGILAKHFGSLEKIRAATEEELNNINEIGTVIAQNVFHFFRTESAMIDDLITQFDRRTDQNSQQNTEQKNNGTLLFDSKSNSGTSPNTSKSSTQNLSDVQHLPLQDMTIVVTGTLEHFKRNEIEDVIGKHGGRPSSSVSSKTTFVLVGAEPGSKLAKAEKLGVRIVYEPEFLKMLEQ